MLCLKIISAILIHRPLNLVDIRKNKISPGVYKSEINFLRFIQKIFEGTLIELNEDGLIQSTAINFRPTNLATSNSIFHICGWDRGICYYLEPLLLLSLSFRKNLSFKLRGSTNHPRDGSVDRFQKVTIPIFRQYFDSDIDVHLSIIKRGISKHEEGEILFNSGTVREMPAIAFFDRGDIKRARGLIYSIGVSKTICFRVLYAARYLLTRHLSDLFIFIDAKTGKKKYDYKGYGMILVAETTYGRYLSFEFGQSIFDSTLLQPEKTGVNCAKALLWEINLGGSIDSAHQGLVLALCAFGKKEKHKVEVGSLTEPTLSTLRVLRETLGLKFDVQINTKSKTIFLSCYRF